MNINRSQRGDCAVNDKTKEPPSEIDLEAEQTAWEWFAEAHPHEAYATWPDRFWRYFQKKCPNVSREVMERFLDDTESKPPALARCGQRAVAPNAELSDRRDERKET